MRLSGCLWEDLDKVLILRKYFLANINIDSEFLIAFLKIDAYTLLQRIVNYHTIIFNVIFQKIVASNQTQNTHNLGILNFFECPSFEVFIYFESGKLKVPLDFNQPWKILSSPTIIPEVLKLKIWNRNFSKKWIFRNRGIYSKFVENVSEPLYWIVNFKLIFNPENECITSILILHKVILILILSFIVLNWDQIIEVRCLD